MKTYIRVGFSVNEKINQSEMLIFPEGTKYEDIGLKEIVDELKRMGRIEHGYHYSIYGWVSLNNSKKKIVEWYEKEGPIGRKIK